MEEEKNSQWKRTACQDFSSLKKSEPNTSTALNDRLPRPKMNPLLKALSSTFRKERGRSSARKAEMWWRRLRRCRGFCSAALPPHLRRVGFIGLGNMGLPMAKNLLMSGYELTVHDINTSMTKEFSKKGIPVKETPAEVALSSDVIITMLPSSSNVLDVYTGTSGLLSCRGDHEPWLYIDCSTIDVQTSRRISKDISSRCFRMNKSVTTSGLGERPIMLDAPVSGGVPAAEAGTLTFMVGGPEEAYMEAKPLLLSMGKRIIYCGGPGNGSAAKICNNLAMAVSMLGVSEALALGQNLGIKASVLSDIFNCSSARCWSSDTYNPVPGVMPTVPSSRDYDGGFSCKLMAKDLGLAMASAAEVGSNCQVSLEAQKIFETLCKEGFGLKDFSCVFRHYYSGKDEK